MAGSLSHIVDDNTGQFTMSLIDNLGDAHEALDECFKIIAYLTDGDAEKVNEALDSLNFPTINSPMRPGGREAL